MHLYYLGSNWGKGFMKFLLVILVMFICLPVFSAAIQIHADCYYKLDKFDKISAGSFVFNEEDSKYIPMINSHDLGSGVILSLNKRAELCGSRDCTPVGSVYSLTLVRISNNVMQMSHWGKTLDAKLKGKFWETVETERYNDGRINYSFFDNNGKYHFQNEVAAKEIAINYSVINQAIKGKRQKVRFACALNFN